jgi:hypothetical protein
MTDSPQRPYSVLGAVLVVWLAVSAGQSLYFLVSFAAPQEKAHLVSCIGGLDIEEQCRRAPDRENELYRARLQQERDRDIQGMVFWGSMLIVSVILLRREQKRAAV